MALMFGAAPQPAKLTMNVHTTTADSDAVDALSSLHGESGAHANERMMASVPESEVRGTGKVSSTIAPQVPPASERAIQNQPTRTASPYSGKGKNKERFPDKLHEILSKEEFDYAVKWLPHGRSFIFVSPEKFTKMVLPLYFKPCKFSSFTRKLYRWGFRQISKGSDAESFFHTNFRRDEKALLEKMSCGPQIDGHPLSGHRQPRAHKGQSIQHSFPALFQQLQGFQPYAQGAAGLNILDNSPMMNQMQAYQSLMNAASATTYAQAPGTALSSSNQGKLNDMTFSGEYGGAGSFQPNIQQKLGDAPSFFADTTVQRQFQAGLFEPLTDANRLGKASASMGRADAAYSQMSPEQRQRRGGAA